MACSQSLRLRSGNIRETAPDPLRDARNQNARQILNWNTLLFHGIAVAQRDRIPQRGILFAECFKINRHAKWRSNFILTTVTSSYRTGLVIKDVHKRAQKSDNLFRFRDERLLVF